MEKLKLLYEVIKHILGFVSKITPILDKGVDGVANELKELEEKKRVLKEQAENLKAQVEEAWKE